MWQASSRSRSFTAISKFRSWRSECMANSKIREHSSPVSRSRVIDVLDHVLDKGIVIDAWVRVSLVGIDLLTIEARVVVASIETYLNYAGTLSGVVVRPAIEP